MHFANCLLSRNSTALNQTTAESYPCFDQCRVHLGIFFRLRLRALNQSKQAPEEWGPKLTSHDSALWSWPAHLTMWRCSNTNESRIPLTYSTVLSFSMGPIGEIVWLHFTHNVRSYPPQHQGAVGCHSATPEERAVVQGPCSRALGGGDHCGCAPSRFLEMVSPFFFWLFVSPISLIRFGNTLMFTNLGPRIIGTPEQWLNSQLINIQFSPLILEIKLTGYMLHVKNTPYCELKMVWQGQALSNAYLWWTSWSDHRMICFVGGPFGSSVVDWNNSGAIYIRMVKSTRRF